jgi:hypothetical protein
MYQKIYVLGPFLETVQSRLQALDRFRQRFAGYVRGFYNKSVIVMGGIKKRFDKNLKWAWEGTWNSAHFLILFIVNYSRDKFLYELSKLILYKSVADYDQSDSRMFKIKSKNCRPQAFELPLRSREHRSLIKGKSPIEELSEII